MHSFNLNKTHSVKVLICFQRRDTSCVAQVDENRLKEWIHTVWIIDPQWRMRNQPQDGFNMWPNLQIKAATFLAPCSSYSLWSVVVQRVNMNMGARWMLLFPNLPVSMHADTQVKHTHGVSSCKWSFCSVPFPGFTYFIIQYMLTKEYLSCRNGKTFDSRANGSNHMNIWMLWYILRLLNIVGRIWKAGLSSFKTIILNGLWQERFDWHVCCISALLLPPRGKSVHNVSNKTF